MSRVSGRKHAGSYLGTIIHHTKDESAKPQRSERDRWNVEGGQLGALGENTKKVRFCIEETFGCYRTVRLLGLSSHKNRASYIYICYMFYTL